MSMTSRERVTAALRHHQPDRTPLFEYVLQSPVADAYLGRPYAADPANWPGMVRELGWEQAARREAEDHVELAARLGHDLMYVVPSPIPDPPGERHVAPAGQGTASDDPVERLRRRNEAEDQEADHPPSERFLVLEYIKDIMKSRGLDLPILAPTYDHGVWADVDLMLTMMLDPEVAREHFAIATRRSMAYLERYLDLGIELIGVGGDFAGNQPLISPELYREFIVPEVARLSRRVHAADGWTVNASDGNLWPVIDDFLIGCEVDGYIEIDLHAGMDLGRLKAAHGPRITFFGNLDCGNILSFGTPEDVARHVRECLDAGSGDGGHILCASNAITASVPLVNYAALLGAYRGYFDLPEGD